SSFGSFSPRKDRSRGFTNDQLSGHGNARGARRSAADLVEQRAHRQPAHLGGIGSHGGKRPVGFSCQVIKTQNTQALRHFNSRHGEGVPRSQRHQVVGGNHR